MSFWISYYFSECGCVTRERRNDRTVHFSNWNWFSYTTYHDDFWNIIWTWQQQNGYPFDWFYITISRNWQILEKWKYNTIRKDWYRVEYFDDWQIYSEWNYDNWKRVWVWNRYLWDWSIWVSKDYWWIEIINDN